MDQATGTTDHAETESIKPSNKKPAIFKFVLLFASITLTLFLADLVFFNMDAVSTRKFNEKCKVSDNNDFANSRGYSLVNNFYEPLSQVHHCHDEWNYTYHINELGFRDSGRKLPEGAPLAIGDSFTFGFGVEDNESFPAILNMHNAGMWGNPFDVQLNSLRRSVELVKPKVVVWGFYPSHIITMMPGEWAKACPGDKSYFTDNSFGSKTLRWLVRNILIPVSNKSAFAKYVKKNLDITRTEADSNGIYVYKNCYSTKEIILYDKNIANNHYTSYPEINKTFQSDRDEIYKQIGEYISEAKSIADDKGIEMYFVIIPSRLNLKLNQGKYKVNYEDSDIDPDLPLNTFKDIITSAGFKEDKIIDLSEYFLKQDSWEKYYFVKDAHWNKLGHMFVAKIIEERINKN